MHIGATLIFKTLVEFDPHMLSERLKVKPEHFTSMINSFTRLNCRSNERDMIKEYLRQQESDVKANLNKLIQSNSGYFKVKNVKTKTYPTEAPSLFQPILGATLASVWRDDPKHATVSLWVTT